MRFAKRLGLLMVSGKIKSQDDKAIEIFQILNKKKFVVLLDDIWKWFDLVRVGVPLPEKQINPRLCL